MTNNQKETVKELRESGLGYKVIANMTSIPLSTVKSFCLKNSIQAASDEKDPYVGVCKNCGKIIHSIPKRKPRQFCSRECGLIWWHAHTEELNKKATYSFVCAECGKEFTSYGKAHRKFCSLQCSAKHKSAKASASNAGFDPMNTLLTP